MGGDRRGEMDTEKNTEDRACSRDRSYARGCYGTISISMR